MSYTLKDFFQEYCFKGKLHSKALLDLQESDFSLEVHKYDPQKGLFVASGNNNGNLLAIIGEITPESTTQSKIRFRPISRPTFEGIHRQNIYIGHLIKETKNILINAREYTGGPLELSVHLKGDDEGPVHMGWMDHAMDLELPTP